MTVLERRRFDRLFKHKLNEAEISSTSEIKNLMGPIKSDTVCFGEVYHDVESGEIRITVSLEEMLSTKIVVKQSVRFRQGIRFDAESREKMMKKLAEKICETINMREKS